MRFSKRFIIPFLPFSVLPPSLQILSFLILQLKEAGGDDKKGRVAEAMRFWVEECGTGLEEGFWSEKQKIDSFIQGFLCFDFFFSTCFDKLMIFLFDDRCC